MTAPLSKVAVRMKLPRYMMLSRTRPETSDNSLLNRLKHLLRDLSLEAHLESKHPSSRTITTRTQACFLFSFPVREISTSASSHVSVSFLRKMFNVPCKWCSPSSVVGLVKDTNQHHRTPDVISLARTNLHIRISSSWNCYSHSHRSGVT